MRNRKANIRKVSLDQPFPGNRGARDVGGDGCGEPFKARCGNLGEEASDILEVVCRRSVGNTGTPGAFAQRESLYAAFLKQFLRGCDQRSCEIAVVIRLS